MESLCRISPCVMHKTCRILERVDFDVTPPEWTWQICEAILSAFCQCRPCIVLHHRPHGSTELSRDFLTEAYQGQKTHAVDTRRLLLLLLQPPFLLPPCLILSCEGGAAPGPGPESTSLLRFFDKHALLTVAISNKWTIHKCQIAAQRSGRVSRTHKRTR